MVGAAGARLPSASARHILGFMSESAARPHLLTVEEYRALEASSDLRHEYVHGVVRAMSGASRRHNRIVLNIATRLVAAAAGGPCRIYAEGVRTRVADDVFYYPDVVVACGEPGHSHEEESPCLVVEVLSPSTELIDFREKALYYRRKSGLEAYVIVHQYERRVERHYRDASGEWQYEALEQGEVKNLVEYHDSRGYLDYASKQLKAFMATVKEPQAQASLKRLQDLVMKAEWIVQPLIPQPAPRASVGDFRAIAGEAMALSKAQPSLTH